MGHLVSQAAIDYHARRDALTPHTTALIAARVPACRSEHVARWLHLHWACCRRTKDRPDTEDLLDVHTAYGRLLEATANEVEGGL